MKVVILGASNKPERYSNKALHALSQHGHQPLPVNPGQSEIGAYACYPSLSAISEDVHTITMYLSPKHSHSLLEQIISAKPKRVIFNPGTENPALQTSLKEAGIEVVNACTLIMLERDQF